MLVQTRRGSLVQDRWPDLVAAAAQLPHGLVLDGELLVWDPEAGRLSFEAFRLLRVGLVEGGQGCGALTEAGAQASRGQHLGVRAEPGQLVEGDVLGPV